MTLVTPAMEILRLSSNCLIVIALSFPYDGAKPEELFLSTTGGANYERGQKLIPDRASHKDYATSLGLQHHETS